VKDRTAKLVANRGGQYDRPERNFDRIASGWRWWFKAKYGIDVPVDLADVSALNIIQKLSRLAHKYKPDSTADVKGYATTWDMTEAYLKRLLKKGER
jgi:hypothetical protein